MIRIVMGEKLLSIQLDHDKPIRILDVGTGTGIWAVEIGYSLLSILFASILQGPIEGPGD